MLRRLRRLLRAASASWLVFALAGLPSTAGAATLPGPSTWSDCRDTPAPVECATLVVPLDHTDPEETHIRLPVKRLPALDEATRIGVLVTIAGGPGQRGTDGVWLGAHTPAIHDRFDIVSWDPRGTSGETHIDCVSDWDPYAGLDRTPDTDTERVALDERIAELVQRCQTRHGDLLPYVGTLEAAYDLERLRRMLGEETISILGMSYGSKVAVTYATLFPDRVRAVVLDGYSDPNQAPGELEVEQAAGFERELNQLLAGCAADPGCPFGGVDPGTAFDDLLLRLDSAALPSSGGSEFLTQSDAYEAIAGYLLRGPEARGHLLEALAAADAGEGEPLRRIADDVRGAYEASGLTMGAFMAISCADTRAAWDALDEGGLAGVTTRVHDAAPRLGAWLWSPPATAGLPAIGLCGMQPANPVSRTEPRPVEHIDAADAGHVLVLATSGDPTTPASSAARASRDLQQATLLILDADHHLAYPFAVVQPSLAAYRCLLDAVETYLVDVRPPTPGTVCAP